MAFRLPLNSTGGLDLGGVKGVTNDITIKPTVQGSYQCLETVPQPLPPSLRQIR